MFVLTYYENKINLTVKYMMEMIYPQHPRILFYAPSRLMSPSLHFLSSHTQDK